MSRSTYKKMTNKDMEAIAKLVLQEGNSHTDAAALTGFPRRSISDFIARNNKNSKDFWLVWDAYDGKPNFEDRPKVFIFDIETSPMLGYFWALFNQNMSIDMIENDWLIMTWAGKWFGEETIYHDSCWDHGFNATEYFMAAATGDKEYLLEADRKVVTSLWAMLEGADMIVAHNGDRFDMKKTTARAVQHGLSPLSPIKKIDTMKIAKRIGAFSSNKLDWLARQLCGEMKIDTGGFDLWKRCLRGDEQAWKHMLDYNIGDVGILEDVWVVLASFDTKSPSFIAHTDSTITRCNSPACGSTNVSENGHTHKTTVSEFIGYSCNDCGKQMRGRKNIRSKEQMAATLLSI